MTWAKFGAGWTTSGGVGILTVVSLACGQGKSGESRYQNTTNAQITTPALSTAYNNLGKV